MTILDTLLERLSRLYLRISQGLLLLMVLGVLTEVILRYVLGRGIVGSAEVTRLVITWLVFLMAFVLYRTRRHIVVTALVDVLRPQARRICAKIIDAAVIALCVYVVIQLFNVWQFLGLTTPVFGIPDTLFKLAPVFCFVPMALQAGLNMAGGAGGWTARSPTTQSSPRRV